MAEPNGGPLDYSLDVVPGPRLERLLVLGSAAVVVTTAVVSLVAYLALAVVPSQRLLTWAGALAVPAAGFGAMGPLLRAASPRRRRIACLVVGLLAAGGLLFARQTIAAMRPTFPQLVVALPDGALPSGFERIREERHGDRFCRDSCPTLVRHYRTPGLADPVRAMVTSLYRHGWDPADRNVAPELNTAARRGRIRADFNPVETDLVRVTLTTVD